MSIPHRLHMIWFQGWTELPTVYKDTVAAWAQHHPHWQLHRWSQRSIEQVVRGEWRALYNMAFYMISKCDIARLAILDRYGGVYADVDTHCFRCLDPLLTGIGSAFIAQGTIPIVSMLPGYRRVVDRLGISTVSNCGMGFTPGHPALQRIQQQIRRNLNSWVADAFHVSKRLEVVYTTGPIMMAMALTNSGVTVLPLTAWQSRKVLGGPSKDDYYAQMAKTEGVYCAHWGEGSWEQSRLWIVVLVVTVAVLVVLCWSRRKYTRRSNNNG